MSGMAPSVAPEPGGDTPSPEIPPTPWGLAPGFLVKITKKCFHF